MICPLKQLSLENHKLIVLQNSNLPSVLASWWVRSSSCSPIPSHHSGCYISSPRPRFLSLQGSASCSTNKPIWVSAPTCLSGQAWMGLRWVSRGGMFIFYFYQAGDQGQEPWQEYPGRDWGMERSSQVQFARLKLLPETDACQPGAYVTPTSHLFTLRFQQPAAC